MAPDRSADLLALHRGDFPLVVPNPWDVGSARALRGSAFGTRHHQQRVRRRARTPRGQVTRDETLGNAAGSSGPWTSLSPPTWRTASPTIRLPWRTVTGAAGGARGVRSRTSPATSRRRFTNSARAVDRVAAAAQAAHRESALVLTARAENYLHGRPDLADTISRLQAFQEAGADVLYAPGHRRPRPRSGRS